MNVGTAARPIEILLVEDDPGDVRLTLETFKDARIVNRITVARDGVEAMACLRRESGFLAAPRPDLILLDLNLPKMSGLEVLEELRSDPQLRLIPVIVVTTSSAERDVVASYERRANAYVVKPVDLDQFIAAIRSIENFWLSVVRLPPEGAADER